MDRMRMLFEAVAVNGTTAADRIKSQITGSGIEIDDFRLRSTMEHLAKCGNRPIGFEEFTSIVGSELRMVHRTFLHQLVIPDWEEFRSDIETI